MAGWWPLCTLVSVDVSFSRVFFDLVVNKIP